MDDLSFFKTLDEARFPYRLGKTDEANIGRITFTMMFFLAPSLDPATADRLAEADAAVRQFLPDALFLWWALDGKGTVKKVARMAPPAFADVIEKSRARGKIQPKSLKLWDSAPLWGGDAPTHLVDMAWRAELDTPYWLATDKISAHHFQLTVPLPWIEAQDRPGLLQALFADLCARLAPTHAVAGLHLSTGIELSWMQEGRETLYPFLRRFPGLMVGHASRMAMASRFRMGTVNWLNAVSEELLDLCGGRAAVLAGLSEPAFVVGDMPGGIIVQAGPSPQLGDRDAGLKIAPYGTLARLLKPARYVFDRYNATDDYAMPGTLYDNDLRAASQREWLTRFDEM